MDALIAVPASDVSVSSSDEYRAFDLDSSGNPVMFNNTDGTIDKFDGSGALTVSSSSYSEYYSYVRDLAVGADGSVYLLRIEYPDYFVFIDKLDSNLEHVSTFQTNDKLNGSGESIDVDSSGNVYYIDVNSSVNQIMKVSSDFTTLTVFADNIGISLKDVTISNGNLYGFGLITDDVNWTYYDKIVLTHCSLANCAAMSEVYTDVNTRTYATEIAADNNGLIYVSSLFTAIDIFDSNHSFINVASHNQDWDSYEQFIEYYNDMIFVMVSNNGNNDIYAFEVAQGMQQCSALSSCSSGTVYSLENGQYFSDDPDCGYTNYCDTYPWEMHNDCDNSDGCDCYWEANVDCVNITPTGTPVPEMSDNFDQAPLVDTGNGSFFDTSALVSATLESGEDSSVLDKYIIEGSLWAKYTPSSDGEIEFNTCNNLGPYMTNTGGLTMQVYTGSDLNSLQFVGGNKNGCSDHSYGSKVHFYAYSGTTYYIQIGVNETDILADYSWYNNSLEVQPYSSSDVPPANDNFSNAFTVTPNVLDSAGDYLAYDRDVRGATMEASEPDFNKYLNSASSIWYTWTSGATAEEMWLDTCEKGTTWTHMDSVISVYTGSAVNDLTLVAENDDWDNPTNLDWGCGWSAETSMLKFTTTPNTTYYFRVMILSNVLDGFDLENSLFTFRNKPVQVPVEPIAQIPSGYNVCSNHGGIAMSIPYALPDRGYASMDAWYACYSWCNANMTDDYPTCQYNGDGPRNCWLQYAPEVEGSSPLERNADLCVMTEAAANYNGNPFPMGTYLGQTTGYLLDVPDEILATLKYSPATDVTLKRQKGEKTVMLEEIADSAPLADVSVTFDAAYATTGKTIEWQTLTADSNPNFGKAFVHGLTDQSGAASSYDLYIPIPAGAISNSVYVCPGAGSLGAVTQGCTNGVEYAVDDPVAGSSRLVAKVEVEGLWYWMIPDQTGTGGQALVTDFDLKDIMTRLEVSTLSNHDIYFGSGNAISASGDTIVISFGTDWDFGTLAYTDLAFEDAGLPLTLAALPGVGEWGAAIDPLNSTITLTAPTSGSGYILADHILRLAINNNKILNPAVAGPYSIDLLITTGGTNTEDGSITVPIVDSDQVMITSFVNTFINFDLDTGYTLNDITNRVDCAYNECYQFNGGAFTTNYTVDFGELTSTAVNKSGVISNHLGVSGEINSIYMDLSSNAINGVVVSVSSANAGLQGPNTNLISGVATDGDNILPNSGRYGYAVMSSTVNSGTIVRNSNCDIVDEYCAPVTAPKLVFNTNGAPADAVRVRVDLAAAAAYTNNPGNYEDTLTFIAVPTF